MITLLVNPLGSLLNSHVPETSSTVDFSLPQRIMVIGNRAYATISSIRERCNEFVKSSSIDIMQFGPQFRVLEKDIKCTPTAVITRDALFLYPLHLELGREAEGFYFLSVHQWGLKFKYNGSFNPRKWGCELAYEKLEHGEKAVPYAPINFGAYKGSVQFNLLIETGMTTTYPLHSPMKMVCDSLFRLPTAICEFGLSQLYRYCISSDAEDTDSSSSPSDNITIDISPTEENSRPLTQSLANNLSSIIIKGYKTAAPNKAFWLNFGIGPVDVNSAITWPVCTGVDFSLQANNYWRLNFSIIYVDGNLSFSGNIQILIDFFGSANKCRQQLDKILDIAKHKTDAAGVPADIITDFIKDTRVALEHHCNNENSVITPPIIHHPVNEVSQPEFIQALAKSTQSDWIIKDDENNFLTGYTSEGDRLIHDFDPDDRHQRYILGGTPETCSPNAIHLGEYKSNFDVLLALKDEPLVAQLLAETILGTLNTEIPI